MADDVLDPLPNVSGSWKNGLNIFRTIEVALGELGWGAAGEQYQIMSIQKDCKIVGGYFRVTSEFVSAGTSVISVQRESDGVHLIRPQPELAYPEGCHSLYVDGLSVLWSAGDSIVFDVDALGDDLSDGKFELVLIASRESD